MNDKGHEYLQEDTEILRDYLDDLGYDVTPEDCAELVIEFGNWERAARAYAEDCREEALTAFRRNI